MYHKRGQNFFQLFSTFKSMISVIIRQSCSGRKIIQTHVLPSFKHIIQPLFLLSRSEPPLWSIPLPLIDYDLFSIHTPVKFPCQYTPLILHGAPFQFLYISAGCCAGESRGLGGAFCFTICLCPYRLGTLNIITVLQQITSPWTIWSSDICTSHILPHNGATT